MFTSPEITLMADETTRIDIHLSGNATIQPFAYSSPKIFFGSSLEHSSALLCLCREDKNVDMREPLHVMYCRACGAR
jgi:hypothetical protein